MHRIFSSEKALQRLLVAMASDGQIEKRGTTKARLYTLPELTQLSSSFMMPEKVLPKDIPTLNTFASYKPYLDRYFSVQPTDRGWSSFEPARISDYKPGSESLLSKVSLELLKNQPSWQSEQDIGSTYENGAALTFLHQFAFNSSRLEGAVESLAETVSIIEDEAGSSDENKLIVKNHSAAAKALTRWILDEEYDFEGDLSKGSGPIKEIHRILMDGLLKDDSEGEVRRSGVNVTGCAYTPSARYEILETALHEIAVISGKIEETFERAFFLFSQVAYLQAFRDGNKRTARLISNIPLISGKKAPHVFSEVVEQELDRAVVYFYETADARPLELLWLESYLRGLPLFKMTREEISQANLAKSQLSGIRLRAVIDIVRGCLTSADAKKLIQQLLYKEGLSEKFPPETALAFVKKDIQKLYDNGTGLRSYALTPEDLKSWRDSIKNRWF
ncbi:MAG: Fic family protein [Chitinophagaceae bacterium]|nr:Fic family protein [Oligoflexus sp.]